MLSTMLLLVMLFPGPPQSPPLIDNDWVAVWNSAAQVTVPLPLDAVLVSLSGGAQFVPKGTTPKIADKSILIELKEPAAPPIANPTTYPLAFPRPGSRKLLENNAVIVWDYTWTPGVPTPMHFHDKDVIVVYLGDGDLKSTTPDGKTVVNSYKRAEVKFNLRNRTHTETLIRGNQRAIITELK
jgi:hypothetical protein